MKEYILKPIMTRPTLNLTPGLDKPAVLPPRQPLPAPVIDPTKPMLKLGLDVHLEFTMVVVQKDHAQPKSPRVEERVEISGTPARRCRHQKEDGGGPGAATGHRPVALAHRPGQLRRPGLDRRVTGRLRREP